MYSDKPNSIMNNDYTAQHHYDDTTPPELDIMLAENAWNAKCMHFHIPPITQSLESELPMLKETLRWLHQQEVAARALLHYAMLGGGSGSVALSSGLILMVDIHNVTSEVLLWLRVNCRQVIRHMARNKDLPMGRGNWQRFMAEALGRLSKRSVANEAKSITNDIREALLAGENATNCVVHYRVSKSGVIESSEVDLAEEPARLKWTPA